MVFKALVGGESGNLYTPAYNYGYFNDTVYVVNEPTASSYYIFTLGGNDTIDLRDANPGNNHFVMTGRGNDIVLGGASLDFVYDTDGNDTCQLDGNNDTVYAGAGNDVYDGGAGIDTLDFRFVNDNVGNTFSNNTGVVCDLKKTTAQFVSSFFGSDIIRSFEEVIGGDGDDTLSGTEGGNRLFGSDGNDVMFGRGGADSIYANNGADTLVGGVGADFLSCFETTARRDHVRYNATNESGLGNSVALVDRVNNFDKGGLATDDKIDLSRIDARAATTPLNEAFTFRGAAAFSLIGGEVRLQVIGTDTLVHVDTDADVATEMNILIFGVTGLTAADFIL